VTDVSNEGHEEMNALEAMRALVTVARLTRGYYEQLLEHGWSEADAFKLTIAWQHAVVGGKAPEA
jgi:hypothetical protein